MEKSSASTSMSVVSEAQDLVRQLAEPRPAGSSIKADLLRAWRRLPRWSFRRVKAAWYAECELKSSEMDMLREAAAKRREAKAQRHEANVENLRQEIEAIRAVLERIAPGALRNEISALRRSADRIGLKGHGESRADQG
jgi:hypothetical protein